MARRSAASSQQAARPTRASLDRLGHSRWVGAAVIDTVSVSPWSSVLQPQLWDSAWLGEGDLGSVLLMRQRTAKDEAALLHASDVTCKVKAAGTGNRVFTVL